MLGIVISLQGKGTFDGYVETSDLYESLQNYGYAPKQVDFAFFRGLEGRLVESGKAEDQATPTAVPKAVRVTSSGAYHIQNLIRMFVFADAVVVDTPILDKEARAGIGDVTDIEDRLMRTERFRSYLDAQWDRGGIHSEAFDWTSVSAELRAHINWIRGKIKKLK